MLNISCYLSRMDKNLTNIYCLYLHIAVLLFGVIFVLIGLFKVIAKFVTVTIGIV